MIQGIKCPQCGGDTTVYDKRDRQGSAYTWRRRRCLKCGWRFTTHETVTTTLQVVCAWCGKNLGTKDGKGQTGVSHGICRKCARKELSKIEAKGK